MTALAVETPQSLIRWHYLWWALAALAVMLAAIVIGNLWLLNFIHVFSSLLWTGIDLFMGFVLGPILRAIDLAARKAVLLRLTPRTLFLMPTLSIITGTTGWFLAVDTGLAAVDYPQYVWVIAALVLVVLMTIQGTGYLLPTNLRVCFALARPAPDLEKITRLMRNFFYVVAAQGIMQVLTIIIMARFVTGL